MVEAQPRPFSWSPKVCFTATIPYMAENSTMEIIYTPAFRFAHLWLTSPGGTCNSDEVGLGALQFLRALEVMREKIGQLGSDLHASFLQKFPGGESVKVFNFICLLAFSELCMYCPPNLPESLCSGWSNFESA